MLSATPRIWLSAGALAGCGTVALAAVGAHGGLAPAALADLRSGVEIEGWHALALLFCALWVQRGGWAAQLAAACFVLGTLMFCAGVYAVAFGGVHLGLVAPTGGVLLMLGWALLALSALTARA